MRKKKTAPAAAAAEAIAAPNPVDDLLRKRLSWIVLATLLLLLAMHSWHAASVYLNPDEALHYRLAHQPTAADAYAESNTNAHPPLLVMSLYYWTHIGNSELFLRLLPILCTLGLVGFAYLWGLRVAGTEVAITFALLLAFMPAVTDLATEIRHYPLAMCFSCGALYFLERSLDERSWKWMAVSSALLWLAILSNYSVLWFSAAFGVYSLWRVWKAMPARAVMAVWAGGQLCALALYAFLYATHISKISASGMSKDAREGWLSSFYCTADTVQCLGRNTFGLFGYISGHPELGFIGGLVFLAGLGVMWSRNRSLLLLIGVHFGTCWAGVAAGLYPYGGSRHSVLFVLPVALAFSYAVVAATGGRLRYAIGLCAVFACAWLAVGSLDAQSNRMPKHARRLADQSVAYLKERVPRGGLVFSDHQSMLLLCYYANRSGYCRDDSTRHFWQFEMDGFRLVSSKLWSLGPDEFVEELRALKNELQLARGAEVWLFDGGWGEPLNRALAQRFGGTVIPDVREFGDNLSVFRIPN